MYQCYTEFCAEKKLKPMKEWFYRHVFNTEFNLAFHQPHTDTCNKCNKFAILLKAAESAEKKKTLEAERELHHRKAENAIGAKRRAKALAKDLNNATISICFDLQKTLPTPLTTNKAYYLRTLWTYNFAIHDLGNYKAYKYTWDESSASRGSAEIAFCLLKFIKGLPENFKKIA